MLRYVQHRRFENKIVFVTRGFFAERFSAFVEPEEVIVSSQIRYHGRGKY
jgi:hypothetical protein